jgi:hypothetical protein
MLAWSRAQSWQDEGCCAPKSVWLPLGCFDSCCGSLLQGPIDGLQMGCSNIEGFESSGTLQRTVLS